MLLLVTLLAAALATTSCADRPAPAPPPAPGGPVPPGAAAMLAGWKLTLPEPNAKGGVAQVDPAAPTPPWLTADAQGHLVFFAPVAGVTTKNSEHARTELNRLENFAAGSGLRTLSASVVVSQVPTEVPRVVIGQLHGADDISAASFVLLYYDGGVLRASVKKGTEGSAQTNLPLLSDVPLGAPFDYTITDGGDGTVTVTVTYRGRTVSASAPVPPAFAGRTVRFQAGAYQQAPTKGSTAAPDDGARVTFSALQAGTAAPPRAS